MKITLDHLTFFNESCILNLATGCHAVGHPILMYDLSVKNVEDVKVGDLLMGDDSTPRLVKRLARGSEVMYKIIAVNGEEFIVNENHILSLYITKKANNNYPSSQPKYINITVKDFLQKSRTFKHMAKLYKKPVLNDSDLELPIPAWELGVYLGDGYYCNNQVGIAKNDQEIVGYFTKKYQYTLQYKFDGNFNICLKNCKILKEKLKNLGLKDKKSSEKFIPKIYKQASFKQRLDVLAGLLDTDGHLSHKGFDYISKSSQLADDIVFLSRSCGLRAKKTESWKKCQGWTEKKLYYRVNISGNTEIIPNRLLRKKSEPRKQLKLSNVYGFKIEKLENDNFYGFELDGNHLYLDGNFFVHHNTGKSIIIKELAEKLKAQNKRILILAHRKELVEQNAKKFNNFFDVGIYSASVGVKDTEQPIIVGQMQSVVNALDKLGKFDYLIIDEVHLTPEREDSQYQRIIQHYNVPVIGLTATPYRMKEGDLDYIGKVIYTYTVKQGIDEGFLSPITNKICADPDLSKARIEQGDYKIKDLVGIMSPLISSSVDKIIAYGSGRKAWIIFCVDVEHVEQITELLKQRGVNAIGITGKSTPQERETAVKAIKEGSIRALVNCEIFTTGFDAPNIDLLACLRPTKSKSLWEQICGRLLRIYEGKKDGLLLDFGGNIAYHGGIGKPLGKIKKQQVREGDEKDYQSKICPMCEEVIPIGVKECPNCGYEQVILPREINHNEEADTHSDLIYTPPEPRWLDVVDVQYMRHKGKAGKVDTLRVRYFTKELDQSEWLCFNHQGYAYEKAMEWAEQRIGSTELYSIKTANFCLEGTKVNMCLAQHCVCTNEQMDMVDRVAWLGQQGKISNPTRIKLEFDGNKYWKVTGYDFTKRDGDSEGICESGETILDEDIPFEW